MAQLTLQSDDSIVAFSAENDAGQRATNAFRKTNPFESQISAIAIAYGQAANEADAVRADLKPDALTRTIRDSLTKHMPAPYAKARDAITAAKRTNDQRVTDLEKPPVDPIIASETRAIFRGLSVAEQHHMVRAAGLESLRAIHAPGRAHWPDITDDLWQAVVDRMHRLAFVEISGISGRFPKQATIDQPCPVGVDQDAVEKFATEAMENLRASQSAVEAAESALSRTIAVVAVAGDMTPAEAFTLLNRAA